MGDALSVAQIAARQREVERELQSVPRQLKEASESLVNLQRDLNKAKAAALLGLEGQKMTVAERDARVFTATEDEWLAFSLAEVAHEFLRDSFKALDRELMSLSSRLKAAMASDQAHSRLGEG